MRRPSSFVSSAPPVREIDPSAGVPRGRTSARGPPAFLTCLWATARYRNWSFTLSKPGHERRAERFFHFVSRRRSEWGKWFERRDTGCTYCDDVRLRRSI